MTKRSPISRVPGRVRSAGRLLPEVAGEVERKENQLPIGIAVLAVVVLIAILLGMKNELLAFFWITGIAFGYILQRARFCFTAAMRDPMLTGGTSLTRAVLIAFAFTSIGFIAIKYGAFARGCRFPGRDMWCPLALRRSSAPSCSVSGWSLRAAVLPVP